jgi:hypothetical protein
MQWPAASFPRWRSCSCLPLDTTELGETKGWTKVPEQGRLFGPCPFVALAHVLAVNAVVNSVGPVGANEARKQEASIHDMQDERKQKRQDGLDAKRQVRPRDGWKGTYCAVLLMERAVIKRGVPDEVLLLMLQASPPMRSGGAVRLPLAPSIPHDQGAIDSLLCKACKPTTT